MTDLTTVTGIVATEPRFLTTQDGTSMVSFRLASPSRVFDKTTNAWSNGPTNWYSVVAFRTLAVNTHASLRKGDLVLVHGSIHIRTWEQDDRSGTTVEIEATSIGHDLSRGRSTWTRTPTDTTGTQPPTETPVTDWQVAAIPDQQ